ncbi:hypothetical protein LMP26_14175, partial [Staphylococcus aureus]|nr:hypothetical protein [Staphylococcus aureus]
MHRVVIDPANDNHVFFAWEFLNILSTDAGRTALMAEVYDNDFVGEVRAHTTLNTAYPLRSSAATTRIG